MLNSRKAEIAFNREVGKRVRESRNNKGITQAKLAEIVGLDPVSIYRIEKGDVKSFGYTIRLLSDALETSTDYLLGKDE